MTSLLTGVFNERCPKPRFCFVWDVEVVLRFLKSLGTNLSNKMLTLKEECISVKIIILTHVIITKRGNLIG